MAERGSPDQTEGLRGPEVLRDGQRQSSPGAAAALPGTARAVQVSALDRIPERSAENRDRQDPTLQVARRGAGSVEGRESHEQDSRSSRRLAGRVKRSRLGAAKEHQD